jgi:hypothetical protein
VYQPYVHVYPLATQVSCPDQVEHGHFNGSCGGETGDQCNIVCDTGYHPTHPGVTCLPSGHWDNSVATICAAAGNTAHTGTWVDQSL